jgi:hypothetical protein
MSKGMTSAEAMQRSMPLTPQEAARRQRDFYEVTEPIRKNMAKLASVQRFSLTICGDDINTEILWEPWAKVAYDKGQELIAYWAERILEQGR